MLGSRISHHLYVSTSGATGFGGGARLGGGGGGLETLLEGAEAAEAKDCLGIEAAEGLEGGAALAGGILDD